MFAYRHNILREHLIEGGRAGPLSACIVELPSPSHSPVAVLFVVTVFLFAQLAAVVYDPYPGPSVALDVCTCPQFMPVEQKSMWQPSETRGV